MSAERLMTQLVWVAPAAAGLGLLAVVCLWANIGPWQLALTLSVAFVAISVVAIVQARRLERAVVASYFEEQAARIARYEHEQTGMLLGNGLTDDQAPVTTGYVHVEHGQVVHIGWNLPTPGAPRPWPPATPTKGK